MAKWVVENNLAVVNSFFPLNERGTFIRSNNEIDYFFVKPAKAVEAVNKYSTQEWQGFDHKILDVTMTIRTHWEI